MNVKELYRNICKKFNNADIDSAELEARFLICDTLGLSSTEFFIKDSETVNEEKTDELYKLSERRINGEPLQYILGKWDFMGRSYKVGPGVLIPRPETELLCEKIIECLRTKKQAVVYDLCSGSGCIGITLKAEVPDIDLYLVEKSPEALQYLLYNSSALLSKTFHTAIKGDVLQFELFELYPQADIIVSNPPYIRSSEVPDLQKEVTFEPDMALDGGEDGLIFYRYIIANWSQKLKDDGEIFFEIGEDQAEAVSAMFREIGFDSRVIKDYNNHDRIVKGRRASYDI